MSTARHAHNDALLKVELPSSHKETLREIAAEDGMYLAPWLRQLLRAEIRRRGRSTGSTGDVSRTRTRTRQRTSRAED